MFLEKTIQVRIRKNDIQTIEEIVEVNKDKYENVSHFVRCAILKLMREERWQI